MVFAAIWGRVSDLRGCRFVLAIGMLGPGLGSIAFVGVLDPGMAGIAAPSLTLVLLIAVRIVQSVVRSAPFQRPRRILP